MLPGQTSDVNVNIQGRKESNRQPDQGTAIGLNRLSCLEQHICCPNLCRLRASPEGSSTATGSGGSLEWRIGQSGRRSGTYRICSSEEEEKKARGEDSSQYKREQGLQASEETRGRRLRCGGGQSRMEHVYEEEATSWSTGELREV